MTATEINLPTAKEVMKELALVEAKKASAEEAKARAIEAEKADLLAQLRKPSGVSREEALKRVTRIIQNAVSNGLTEVRVIVSPMRFAPIGVALSISRKMDGRRR